MLKRLAQCAEILPNGESVEGGYVRNALICYEGDFESLDGPVSVTKEDLQRIADNYNSHLKQLRKRYGFCPRAHLAPLQLDHGDSANETIGRVVGPLMVSTIKNLAGEEVHALFGRTLVLGQENIEKAKDGRYASLSIGADFENGDLQELTVTPFPAAREASFLSKSPSNIKRLKSINNKLSKGSGMNLKALARYFSKQYDMSEDEAMKMVDVMPEQAKMSAYEQVPEEMRLMDDKEQMSGDYVTKDEMRRMMDEYTSSMTETIKEMMAAVPGKPEGDEGEKKEMQSEEDDSESEKEMAEGKPALPMDEQEMPGMDVSDDVKRTPDETVRGDVVREFQEVDEKLSDEEKKMACAYDEKSEMEKGEKDEKKEEMQGEDESKEDDMEGETLEEEIEEVARKLLEALMDVEEVEETVAKGMIEDMPLVEMKKKLSEIQAKQLEDSEQKEKEKKIEDIASQASEISEQMSRMGLPRDAMKAIQKLSRSFSDSSKTMLSEMRLQKVKTRIARLRSAGKLTPAEIKKMSVKELAKKSDESISDIFSVLEKREPVVRFGSIGTAKPLDIKTIEKEISRLKQSELEEEALNDMPYLKKTLSKNRNANKSRDIASVHKDETKRLREAMNTLLDSGNIKEARLMMNKAVNDIEDLSFSENQSAVEEEKRFEVLEQNVNRLSEQFGEFIKLFKKGEK